MEGLLKNHLEMRKMAIAAGFVGNQNFQKSNNDELRKGGEGSKGGKVVGHTKTGKPIYEHGSTVKFKAGNSVASGKYKGEVEGKKGYHKIEQTQGTGNDTRTKVHEVHERSILHNDSEVSQHRDASFQRNKKSEQRNAERSNLKKSNGEGSRGGKIIGHTKSGKPIYGDKGAGHADYSNFSHDDHKEANMRHVEQHQKLSKQYKQDKETVAQSKFHLKAAKEHNAAAGQKKENYKDFQERRAAAKDKK